MLKMLTLLAHTEFLPLRPWAKADLPHQDRVPRWAPRWGDQAAPLPTSSELRPVHWHLWTERNGLWAPFPDTSVALS